MPKPAARPHSTEAPIIRLLRRRASYRPADGFDRVVIAPDLCHRDAHPGAVGNLIRFIDEWQPDRVLVVAASAAPCQVGGSSRCTTKEALGRLRNVFSKSLLIHADDVPVESGGPACCAAALADNSVEVIAGVNEVAPGWLSIRATGPGGSRYSGAQAITLARTLRHSVICSGTRGLGLIAQSRADQAPATTLRGLEPGTLRRPTPSSKGFRATLGFGVIDSTAGSARATPVAIARNGDFEFDDARYRATR